jgi:hypothetical protein
MQNILLGSLMIWYMRKRVKFLKLKNMHDKLKRVKQIIDCSQIFYLKYCCQKDEEAKILHSEKANIRNE